MLRVTLASDSTGVLSVDDNGGSLTVDGTVTADLGATDNAVLDQIEVNTSYGDSVGGGVEAGVLRVTVASDSSGVLSVDDNGASLTVDGTVTADAGTGPWPVTDNGGTLSVDDGAGSLTVDAAQLDVDDLAPTSDGVSAALDTSQVMAGLTALTPKFAAIDVAVSGDNTLVAAVASKKVRVLSAFLVSAGTVTTRFESGAAGTALTGQMNLVANTGFVLPFNPVGWFETGVNTLLNLELSAAVSVDGSLVYVEV